jgi:hypothetical protein
VRRFAAWSGLLVLAGVAPACLLYTDPINSPPQVMIVAPQNLHPNQTATFQGRATDPDGDAVVLSWAMVGQACGSVKAADWDASTAEHEPAFSMRVNGHQPFCLRLVAQDSYGAQSAPQLYDGKAQNRPPVTTLAVDPPLGAGSFPLFTTFRLSAGPYRDDDDDAVDFIWKATDPAGADMSASLTACDPASGRSVRCFSASKPGAYAISVEASDGLEGGKGAAKTMTLPVLEDGPPCIEITSPTAETGMVVLAVNAPPRSFEVRRVRDDGNPFPAGPNGGATFQWFTQRPAAVSWTKWLGYDRPSFDISAASFEDVRPGSIYRVRVEVRDPQHESDTELRGLDVTCRDADICMVPDKCVRWVTWSVRFQ